jgi:hypothetical protein
MRRTWASLAVVVLLASTAAMRAANAATGSSTATEIDLTTVACGAPHTHCYFFALSGPGNGAIVRTNVPVLDEDGTVVGRHRSSCTLASHASGVCTTVISLHHGSYTDDGTVVFSGLFDGTTPATFAIAGGTGAYTGVGGYVTFDYDGTNYPTTLYFTP